MTSWIDPAENTDGVGDGQRTLNGQQLAGALALLGSVDPVCAEVLTRLNLRVYPGEAGDRTAYVVLDVHGVSIGVKRRAAGLYLHADTTDTDDRLIAFEINGGGETDHPTS
ncbi:hypothetical protein HCB17_25290 [Salinispora arenicola]|uniref:hypothetical protein n=1 Tax=Salinispora arenicola TaxID=168697 RepID=UPI0014318891|nr:hypothetical protein [Salinispora arenicola]NIL44055.1 hypothetical protein [Salinispora arenicola]NIL64875.1 hypothetical protein [Salinispora arenicola]